MDNGVSVPEWGGRRAQAALEQVRANGHRNRTPCCICLQPINYKLRKPDPGACTVQHIKSRKRFPELTWDPANWAPAHATCNYAEGTGERDPITVVAATSTEW